MTNDWIFRVGDGTNLINSSKYRIWGINSNNSVSKYFIKNVQVGDRLWFVTSKSNGKIIAVATYSSHNTRVIGPLIDMTMTNEELGWNGSGVDWYSDIEIHYTNLYGLEKCEILSHIKGPATIREYNDKCRVNLPIEYSYIVKYSKITHELK